MSARPSQAAVERAIKAADKFGLRPRALDLLPDGRVRLHFDEPENEASANVTAADLIDWSKYR